MRNRSWLHPRTPEPGHVPQPGFEQQSAATPQPDPKRTSPLLREVESLTPPGNMGRIHDSLERLRTDIEKVSIDIDRAQAEAEMARLETEQQELRLKSHKRVTNALWWIVLLLILSLALAAWLAFPLLQKYRSVLDGRPGLPDSAQALGETAGSDQQQPGLWTYRWNQSNPQTAEPPAAQTVHKGGRLSEVERAERIRTMQAQLDALESAQRAERVRLEQLERAIANVRRNLTPTVADGLEASVRR